MRFLLVALALLLAAPEAFGQERPHGLAFTHVTVVDVTGGPSLPDMTLIVRGNLIEEVGPSADVSLPVDVTVVDGTGRFLIPGLWDMHVHLFNNVTRVGTDNADWYFPLFIANGVIGVRDMWTDPDDLAVARRWRRALEGGTMLGPRVAVGSSIVDGVPTFVPNALGVATPDEARRAVRMLHEAGAGFIKVYWNLSPDAYFALAEEAETVGLPLAGHVPFALSARAASDAGQRSIEHLTGILETCSSKEDQLRAAAFSPEVEEELWRTYDEQKCAALFARFAENGTWHTPTAVLHRALTFSQDAGFADDVRLRYVPAAVAERWRNPSPAEGSPLDLGTRTARFRRALDIVGAMHRAGVMILAGTDVGNPFLVPGYSLHRELELLVEAGLTPLEALQTATLNPARYFGTTDSTGTIAPGQLADLVLLDADPLADITNTQRIRAVVANGRLLTRTDLDRLLAEAEASAQPR